MPQRSILSALKITKVEIAYEMNCPKNNLRFRSCNLAAHTPVSFLELSAAHFSKEKIQMFNEQTFLSLPSTFLCLRSKNGKKLESEEAEWSSYTLLCHVTSWRRFPDQRTLKCKEGKEKFRFFPVFSVLKGNLAKIKCGNAKIRKRKNNLLLFIIFA